MISKQIPVKAIGDTLKYVSAKKEAAFVDSNLAADEVDKMQREFEFVAGQNSRKEHHYRHIILSLAPGESLSIDQWQEVGKTWRSGMHDQQVQRHDRKREEGAPPVDPDQIPSYDSSPFAMWIHNDRKHQHVHMVCSVIDFDGQVVSDSFERYRSEAVCRQIEREFGLHQVRSSKEKAAGNESKLGEHNIIRQAIDQAVALADSPISFQQLIAELQHEGIQVAPSVTRRTGKIKGIRYRFDEDGEWIAGTQIGKEYTFQGLSKHLGVTYEPERDSELITELCSKVVKKKEIEIGIEPPEGEGEEEVTEAESEPLEGEVIDQLPTQNELPNTLEPTDLDIDPDIDPDIDSITDDDEPTDDEPVEIVPVEIVPPLVDEVPEQPPDLVGSISSIDTDVRPGVEDTPIVPPTVDPPTPVEPPAPPPLTPEQVAQAEYDTTAADIRAKVRQPLDDEQITGLMFLKFNASTPSGQPLAAAKVAVLFRSPVVQEINATKGFNAAKKRLQEIADSAKQAQASVKTPPVRGDGR